MSIESPAARALAGLVRVSLSRSAAGALLIFLLAFPVRALVLSGDVAVWLKIVWLGLLAVGVRMPSWSGAVLLVLVPLLPVWPYHLPGVPQGLVHLGIASQAIPFLFRKLRAPIQEQDPLSSLWLLFIGIGIVSSIVVFAGYPAVFPSALGLFGPVIHALEDYVFLSIGRGIPNTIVAATTLVDGWLAYTIVRDAARAGHTKRLVTALGVTAVLVASFGIVQSYSRAWLRSMWLVHDPGLVRIHATYADPNSLAAYFVVPLAVLVAVALGATRRRWPALAGLGLVTWALVLTAGRAGYIGAAVGIVAILFQVARRRLYEHAPWPPLLRRNYRTLVVLALALSGTLLLVLTALGTAWNVTHASQGDHLHTLLYTLNMGLPLNERLKGRIELWNVAWLMIRDHWGWGLGLGMFFSAYPKYYAQVGGTFAPDSRMSAHSTFLGIWAELGIVGLAVWAGLLVAALWLASRRPDCAAATSQVPFGHAMAWVQIGLTAGLLGYVSTMLTGDRTILREDTVMLGAWTGLAAAFAAPPLRLRTLVSHCVPVLVAALLITLPFRVDASRRQVPLDQLSWGFYDWEIGSGETRYRWSGETAFFYVSCKATSVVVPIRSLAPFAQDVTIMLNDVPVDALALTDHEWHTRRYPLDQRLARRGYHRIELRARPLWSPATDTRRLGVIVGEVSVKE